MRKGSITVFLSLILVLLFSFLITTVEAARIQGARAYTSMVSTLAGDSFLATYYYPLFKDYRLFAVNGGDREGYFSVEMLEEEIRKNVAYGLKDINGGMLNFQNTAVEITDYTSLLSEGETEFLSQVSQQAVLDGLALPLQELFPAEQIKETVMVGELYREQETALEATATVATALLKLMELADGVCVTDNGIAFDKAGNIKVTDSFIKQILPLEKYKIKELYENKDVFEAISDRFVRVDSSAEKVKDFIAEARGYMWKISDCNNRIAGCERRIEALEEKKKELSLQKDAKETERKEVEEELEEEKKTCKEEKKKKRNYEGLQEDALSKAKAEYKDLKKRMQNVQEKGEKAFDVLQEIETKQKAAQVMVAAYEGFLQGTKPDISEELFQAFSKELEMMKSYAGLAKSGLSTEQMRESLTSNSNLLNEIALGEFSVGEISRIATEMDTVINRMKEYTTEGLWFSYGEVVASEHNGKDVTGVLKDILSQGIFSLVGLEEEKISGKSLDGKSLPSDKWKAEKKQDKLPEGITEILELLQSGEMVQLGQDIQNGLSDKVALELYSRKYFCCYGEETEDTRLEYEREYLLFGRMEDKENLLDVVLYLIAVRTLFCLVMLIKQPDKMAELDSFANGIAGLTGIPALASVIKYSLLMLWAVEEALVEVAILMQGKKIPLAGKGQVEFWELFVFNKTTIEQKAAKFLDRGGTGYGDYLTFLSLLKGTTGKAYRAMDLIQENMRLRYNDSFRMINQVTGLSFRTNTKLKTLFDTGFFAPKAYEMDHREEVCFGACS